MNPSDQTNSHNARPTLPEAPYKIEIADEQSHEIAAGPIINSVTAILNDHDIATAEISVAIVDDPTIRQLNRQYLEHDYETDVISFVLEWDEIQGRLVGQLIVSTDTAASLAGEVGGSMGDELLLYVIHGTLHLVGYDDKAPDSAAEMRVAEKKYLKRLGIEHRGFEKTKQRQAE